jgi:hypothetical protein
MQVIALKGKKNVYIVTNGERKHMTAVVCGSADGELAPTMIILKGLGRVLSKHCGWDSAYYTNTENGYMENEVWLEWCKVFVGHTKPTASSPVVLIADQHDSRLYLPAIMYLQEHHVRLLCLAPHTTHKLQPLDVCFFGPFKRLLRQIAKAGGGDLSMNSLSKYVRDALGEASKVTYNPMTSVKSSNLISAFKGTGVHPYNPSIVKDSDYGMADHLAMRRLRLASDEGIVDLTGDTLLCIQCRTACLVVRGPYTQCSMSVLVRSVW